jgi:DNA-binding NtrC family response regulator
MKKKLLIVDDDISIKSQIRFALEKEYDVIESSTTKETLELIEKYLTKIDIALVDLGLPPFENTQREGKIIVKKLLEKTEAKIIILTGQENQSYPKEFISMGIFDFLYKPIEIPKLKDALKRASFFIDNESKEDNIKLSFSISLNDGLKHSSEEAQKQLLLKVLSKTDFNVSKTAKILGISRENCHYFIKKFGIKKEK